MNRLNVSELLFCFFLLSLSASASEPSKPKWIRVSSDHFSVLTDADEKRAREVAVRFEQMRSTFGQLLLRRKLNMSEPVEIIALRGDKEYADIAPVRRGQVTDAPGFFLGGPDRDYIVLNLFEPESWRAVAHEMAHYFLNYNYPPTQPWFDEGFAEYFSSLHLHDKSSEIGGDPELGVTWNEDVFGNQIQARNPPRSLTEQLDAPVWLSLSDLLTMHEYHARYQEGTRHTLFYAQSWMVVHYLLNKNKLAETGTYFDLTQNKNLPVPEAVHQAYGISIPQFDQAVKDYFNSLIPLFLALDASKQPDTKAFDLSSPAYQVVHLMSPLAAEDVGTSTAQISEAQAQASVAEMALRLPEHRQQAVIELKSIVDDPRAENAIAHRGLAWAHMQKKEIDEANQELSQASQLDPKDPWAHYYLALIKYQQAETNRAAIPGLANLMQDLRAVLDWNPDFAEAYNMLAVARLEGGGTHSAMDAMQLALQLDPRNQTYLFNLARIDMAGKKWEDATELLNRLKASPDAQIAHAARKSLEDLPTLKKYGVLPQSEVPKASPLAEVKQPEPSGDSESQPPPPPARNYPDKRPVKFLKGTLTSVDCSHPPVAVVTVTAAGKMLKLRTEDYKALVVIGSTQFSCQWSHVAATFNYKAGGKSDGDLVSLEVQ